MEKRNQTFSPREIFLSWTVVDPVILSAPGVVQASAMKRGVQAVSPSLPALTSPKYSLGEWKNPFPSLTCGALKENMC